MISPRDRITYSFYARIPAQFVIFCSRVRIRDEKVSRGWCGAEYRTRQRTGGKAGRTGTRHRRNARCGSRTTCCHNRPSLYRPHSGRFLKRRGIPSGPRVRHEPPLAVGGQKPRSCFDVQACREHRSIVPTVRHERRLSVFARIVAERRARHSARAGGTPSSNTGAGNRRLHGHSYRSNSLA